MTSPKQKRPAMKATMRDFRAAPAKILRRAARTGAELRLGEFVLSVREVDEGETPTGLYGAMSKSGRVVGNPSGLLSADDTWST